MLQIHKALFPLSFQLHSASTHLSFLISDVILYCAQLHVVRFSWVVLLDLFELLVK